MAIQFVTFEDKVATRESSLPRKNSVTAEDLTELKNVINNNANEAASPTQLNRCTQVISSSVTHSNGTTIDIDVVGIFVNTDTQEATAVTCNEIGVEVPDIGLSTASYLLIDSDGLPVFQQDEPTQTQLSTHLCYWVIVHSNLTTINVINDKAFNGDNLGSQFLQVLEVVGSIKSGLIPAIGTQDTRVSIGEGMLFSTGIGTTTQNKNSVTFEESIDTLFRFRTQLAETTGDIDDIPSTQYDNAGTLTALTGNQWVAHLAVIFPSGLIRFQYGQYAYANIDAAKIGIQNDSFILEDNIRKNGTKLGWVLIRRNTVDWSDTTRFAFIPFNPFGTGTIGATVVPTLQAVINVSEQPQGTLNDVTGALQLKSDLTDQEAAFQEWLDNLDTIRAYITGKGGFWAASLGVDGQYKFPTVDGILGQVPVTNGAGIVSWETPSTGITIGTTTITGGAVNRILFEGSGNVIQQDAQLTFDGSTFKFQFAGATSGDANFVLRDNGNTFNILEGHGNGTIIQKINATTFTPNTGFNLAATNSDCLISAISSNSSGLYKSGFYTKNGGELQMFTDYGNATGAGSTSGHIWFNPVVGNTYLNFGNDLTNGQGVRWGQMSAGAFQTANGQSMQLAKYSGTWDQALLSLGTWLGATTTGLPSSTYGGNTFHIKSGTAPTAAHADTFNIHAKDIVAGNCAAHFMTENGDIQKIYSIAGWGTPTGTLTRTTFATYTGQEISAVPTQAEVQAIDDHVKILSERLAATISDLKTGHQLFKA